MLHVMDITATVQDTLTDMVMETSMSITFKKTERVD